MKRLALVVLLPFLAACASGGAWSSNSNSPDASMEAQCRGETSGVADANARATAFQACMSRSGWKHSP
ncbi:hypothetical protein [Lysobacter sp. HA18]